MLLAMADYSVSETVKLLCRYRSRQERGITRPRHADEVAELADLDRWLRDLYARGALNDTELSALCSRFMCNQPVELVALELDRSERTILRATGSGLRKLTDALNGYYGPPA